MRSNDFFQRMTREAMEELAKGEKGWKETEPNTLVLACFGMLYNHLTTSLTRPLWFFAGTVATGVVWLVVSKVLGIG